jgi:hypothetical protein
MGEYLLRFDVREYNFNGGINNRFSHQILLKFFS